jgi:hypothetical protein
MKVKIYRTKQNKKPLEFDGMQIVNALYDVIGEGKPISADGYSDLKSQLHQIAKTLYSERVLTN